MLEDIRPLPTSFIVAAASTAATAAAVVCCVQLLEHYRAETQN